MASLVFDKTLPKDLKVTVKNFSIVRPVERTERRNMFLSNIDQVLHFDVQTIHFFEANAYYSPKKVAEMIEEALRKLLVPYDFLAGRLKANPVTGRLEIDCNAAGAGFVVASSELSLAEIGNLLYPNPAFKQLIQVEYFHAQDLEDRLNFFLQVPFIFSHAVKEKRQIEIKNQVTSFRCGGFSMSISTSHIFLDGISFKMFLENMASFVAGKPLASIPCNDRGLLAARSPPQVSFPHPELLEIQSLERFRQTAELFQTTPENLDIQNFQLSENDIMKLKKEAQMGIQEDGANIKITSFNVVMAHIWRSKALSMITESCDPEKIFTILYAVDIRPRLGPPPFPTSYTGNAIISTYGMAKYHELKERPFSYLVNLINEGTSRVTDEYVRSVIDWGELHKGLPYGDVFVSSWWKLGFEDVEFPWGRGMYCCPLVKDVVILLPDMEQVNGKGVNVLLSLPASEVTKFQELFTGF